MFRVCIADDDPDDRRRAAALCAQLRVEVRSVSDGSKAWTTVESGLTDLLVVDEDVPGLSTRELITRTRQQSDVPVLVLTTDRAGSRVAELLEAGAEDFVAKPLQPIVFRHRLDALLQRLRDRTRQDRVELRSHVLEGIVGQSPQMRSLRQQVRTLARTDVSLTLLGEVGTGRGMLARSIHRLSERSRQAFVVVDCFTLPDSHFEGAVFGHQPGAFDDQPQRPGLVDAASGGTMYLDDASELSPPVQGRLLRFLQDGRYKPVGSDGQRQANVRVLVASRSDLLASVREQRFREDLYERLSVFTLRIPPLRDRRADIPILAVHFVTRLNRRLAKQLYLAEDALDFLTEQPWPGNVAELESLLERTALRRNGVVRADHLRSVDDRSPRPDQPSSAELSIRPYQEEKRAVLARFERSYLERLLETEQGHLSRAAQRAGINRKNLWQLLRRHDIDVRSFKPAKIARIRP